MTSLESIRNDHTSGAHALALRCAVYFREQALESPATTVDAFVADMSRAGTLLLNSQPAMASVHHAVYAILASVPQEAVADASVDRLRSRVVEAADLFIQSMKSSIECIATVGIKLIMTGSTVLTYSSSTAVASILKKAHSKGIFFRTIIAESRPMYEGRLLCEDLASAGIPCTLIIDGGISAFFEEADIILVGADRISEQSVVNKIGTRGLALMAGASDIPVYCACESVKFLHSDRLPFTQNEMPAREVWENAPDNVTVRNIYFEEIPLDLFTGFVTDNGILNKDEIILAVKALY